MRHAFRLFVCAFVLLSLPASAAKLVRAAKPVKESYIVVLHETERGRSAQVASELASRHGAKARAVFTEIFPGFVAGMTERQASAMLRDPRVAFIEEDAYGEVQATQTLPSFEWYALDRIDQRQRGWSTYPYTPTYNYCQTGAGVKAYVIDTGVWRDHVEFWTNGQSRVTAGLDFSGSPVYEGTADNPCPSMGTIACDAPALSNIAHGTAVASIIGGNTYGVAKGVTIVPIRVGRCDQSFLLSAVLQGLDAIVNLHGPNEPAVVNMSFAFGWNYDDNTALTYAVNRVIDDGVTAVAAAGNHNRDAYSFMPANNPRVITVGGSDHWDRRWVAPYYDPNDPNEGSNWGGAIDLFAPAGVKSAGIWSCDANGYAVRDPQAPRMGPGTGTSFSAALVTGVVAQYLQKYPTATPAQVTNWLLTNATANALAPTDPDLAGPNKLLYTNCL